MAPVAPDAQGGGTALGYCVLAVAFEALLASDGVEGLPAEGFAGFVELSFEIAAGPF